MSRKRAESLKGLPLPTSNRPQNEKEMASMHNYRESGILLLSLTQSRQAWTSSILKKFSSKQEVVYHPVLPEHTNPTASVSLLGKCHITIGPHTFYDTKIYEAVYEKEVRNADVQSGSLQIQPNSLTGSQFQSLTQTASQPESQSLTQPVATVPLQSSAQTQQSSTPKVNSYSTASRPIQPAIQPRPTNQPQSQVPIQPRGTTKISARSTPSNSPTASSTPTNVQSINSNASSYMNSNLNSNISSLSASDNAQNVNGSRVVPPSVLPANSQLTALFQSITPSQILVIQEQLRQPQAAINMTPEQKNALINQLTTIHQLLTTPQQIPQQQIHSRPQPLTTRSKQVVRYEVLLEFRETKSDKWLFPKEAILEALSMSDPYDVLASFYLPQNEETTVSKQEYQPVTMHLTHLTQSTWDALQKVTNDITSVFQSMATKVNKQPNREYLLHCLPCDYPEDLLEIIGKNISRLDGTLIVDTIALPKEKRRRIDKEKEKQKKDTDMEIDVGNDKDVKGMDVDLPEPSIRKSKSIPKNGEGSKPKTNPKRVKPVPHMTPNVVHPPVSSSSGGNKRCAYCFTKNTPMWRRGPDGAGTLCNACGVKWKQGKILQGSNAGRTVETIDSSSKHRKYSLSTANSTATTVTPAARTKRKSGRSLSMSEATTATVLCDEISASPDAALPDAASPLRSPHNPPSSSTSQEVVSPATPVQQQNSSTSISSRTATVSTPSASQNTSGGYPINLKLNSVLFGINGGNNYFSQPNCSAEIFENYLKIRLSKEGCEKTEIDIWKESIDFITFDNERDLATGFPILSIQARVDQYLSRFDQELLNPDRNDTLVMFKFINLNVNFRSTSVAENSPNDSNGESFRSGGESTDLKTFLEKWLTTGNNVIRIISKEIV